MRKPKPNPLLETVVLAKERANLVAGLLSEREPDAFEVLYTDFTQLVYGGGKVWFLPILDHRTRMVIGYAISFSPDVRTALQAWERAKAFILTQKRERPKAIVHHDQGGAFLSHAWVGHLHGSGTTTSIGCIQACGHKTPQEMLKEALSTSKVYIT
ncbi:DDE-type integrase/transposase/recombinase [Hydrogenibacillus schlegelii]|uniref:DDE-type integrase/transposase/recombinase n=1 Tax=Hydrogenibacillus schlegelii TaxID=1484 RepID=UPI002355419C|nr:DDE-type integrase/transposase/recombinase [Hydrogenibacillus schlegelii]